MKPVTYALGVLAIVIFVVIMLALFLMVSVAHGEQPSVGWQLGICVDDPVVIRRCRLVGAPLPDEQLCKALRDSMRSKINVGRVHCTKVLIDAKYET